MKRKIPVEVERLEVETRPPETPTALATYAHKISRHAAQLLFPNLHIVEVTWSALFVTLPGLPWVLSTATTKERYLRKTAVKWLRMNAVA
jgi:hypothetical protein